jgi:hypothetical protein
VWEFYFCNGGNAAVLVYLDGQAAAAATAGMNLLRASWRALYNAMMKSRTVS